ncbi:MAG: M23 family metallopeptidase, partial [Dongiaceae bacterium]
DTDADLTTDPASSGALDPGTEPVQPDPTETEPTASEPATTQTAAVDPMLIEPAARSSGTFLWPVNGKVVSEFGAAADGLHNDGINIAAPRGTPVRAAENGVVVYSGNELRGFGNLLLVRHADGFVSAYAHNESLLVERGATVERGQTIARVGSSGSVTSPQLHFELRRGTEAVDPREYLGDLGA